MPLVVPEVNADALVGFTKKNIIANPNCSTAQLVVVLKPLHDLAKIKRVVVSTYQSVSGAGKEAMDELWDQTKGIFVTDPAEPKNFTKQIAFNVIPHIDVFLDSGSTKEEWKMTVETKKILDPKIKVTATCVRVPVFVGHSEAVNIEFENPITAAEARRILREAPGVLVVDKREPGGYVTPVECVGDYATFVSPHPQGPDRRKRAVSVDRVRQSAQGRRAQRGADRRDHHQPQAARPRRLRPRASRGVSVSEASGLLLETEQLAGGQVEMQPVQVQQSFFLPLLDEREGAEIGHRRADRRELERNFVAIGEGVGLHQLEIVEQGQPAADEALLRHFVPDLVPIGRHPAAMRMPQHDQARHFQRQHGKLDGGAGAVIFALRLVGRHQIGDVPQNEQRARLGVEDRRHVDARVATGDHHRRRRLAELGQLLVAAAVLCMLVAPEAEMTLDSAFSVTASLNPLGEVSQHFSRLRVLSIIRR